MSDEVNSLLLVCVLAAFEFDGLTCWLITTGETAATPVSLFNALAGGMVYNCVVSVLPIILGAVPILLTDVSETLD